MELKQYFVAYLIDSEVFFYTFSAEDAEHAIEQFRSAEPDTDLKVVEVTLDLGGLRELMDRDYISQAVAAKMFRQGKGGRFSSGGKVKVKDGEV